MGAGKQRDGAGYQEVVAAAERLSVMTAGVHPRVIAVLGSGIARALDGLRIHAEMHFADLPGFAAPGVAGHAGRFVCATAGDTPVLIMEGRLHLYEGHAASRIVLPVRAARALGAEALVATNAAGGLDPAKLDPGDLVLLRDHINLQGASPLVGPNVDELGPRFPVMADAYDSGLIGLARERATARGIRLKEGVYAGVLGPAFETPAEVDAIRSLGADLVGMSTVPEVIAARHCGMRVLGLSLCTNVAGSAHGHDEVLAAGERAAPVLGGLVADILTRL